MCCYLHADLPGFLSSCSRDSGALRAAIAQRSLNAIFVGPRCARIEGAFLPSDFSFCSVYKALLWHSHIWRKILQLIIYFYHEEDKF